MKLAMLLSSYLIYKLTEYTQVYNMCQKGGLTRWEKCFSLYVNLHSVQTQFRAATHFKLYWKHHHRNHKITQWHEHTKINRETWKLEAKRTRRNPTVSDSESVSYYEYQPQMSRLTGTDTLSNIWNLYCEWDHLWSLHQNQCQLHSALVLLCRRMFWHFSQIHWMGS